LDGKSQTARWIKIRFHRLFFQGSNIASQPSTTLSCANGKIHLKNIAALSHTRLRYIIDFIA
jgi:hypothetical protein